MKKLLTLALAFIALGVLTSLAVGQDKQKLIAAKVTKVKVDGMDKTFAVEVIFSAAKLQGPPKVGEIIDATYTQTPGGPMEASSVKSSKSNTSDRLSAEQYKVTGKLVRINDTAQTFTVEVTFSARNLNAPLPEVGKIYDITFTSSTTPGEPPMATTIQGSKSSASSF